MKNSVKCLKRVVYIIICILIVTLVACICIHIADAIGNQEERIDKMIHAHDGQDEFLGLGGRMTAEEKLDYMILKYTAGLDGTREWEKKPDPIPVPKPSPMPIPEPTPTPDPSPVPETDPIPPPEPAPSPTPDDDLGLEPSGIEHPVDKGWRKKLQKYVDTVEFAFELTIPVDIDEKEIMTAIFDEAKYHTGENGIFLDSIIYYRAGEHFSVEVDYPRQKEEIIDIKKQTAIRENEVFSSLGLEGKSDYEKIKKINKYVCDFLDYPAKEPYSDVSHTAYGALFEKSAVCDGYSRLIKMLCDDAGLDCYIVVGDAGGGHAWNLVKINEKWYHLDATWNDTGCDLKEYFLIPDSYIDKTRKWNKKLYPEVSKTPFER